MKKLLFLLLCFFSLSAFSQTVATQVTLSATAGDDDGSITSYHWTQISGPAAPTIVTPNAVTTVVKDYSVAGTYKYEIAVTDNQGAISKDTTTVIVLPANKPPHVKANATITIQLPAQTSFNTENKDADLAKE